MLKLCKHLKIFSVRGGVRSDEGDQSGLHQQLLPAQVLGGGERAETESHAGRPHAPVPGEGQVAGALLGVHQLQTDGNTAVQEQAGSRVPVFHCEHRPQRVEGLNFVFLLNSVFYFVGFNLVYLF